MSVQVQQNALWFFGNFVVIEWGAVSTCYVTGLNLQLLLEIGVCFCKYLFLLCLWCPQRFVTFALFRGENI